MVWPVIIKWSCKSVNDIIEFTRVPGNSWIDSISREGYMAAPCGSFIGINYACYWRWGN